MDRSAASAPNAQPSTCLLDKLWDGCARSGTRGFAFPNLLHRNQKKEREKRNGLQEYKNVANAVLHFNASQDIC